MSRFWAELTPAQRRRIHARLRDATEEEAAGIWDAMGLPERDALLNGSGALVQRS